MDADPGEVETDRRIMIPAIIATAVLLVGGIAIALMPALVFHSGLASVYGSYPSVGMVIGLLSLVPANIWALSLLWPRTRRRFRLPLVLVLVVLTAVAAGILWWTFVVIYLSTIDWFVF